jgi:hypothetical protein
MSNILKSLTSSFTAVPQRSRDAATHRRVHLCERLAEQKLLLANPNYVRKTVRWQGNGEQREQVEHVGRVRPWWRLDAEGRVVMTVQHAGRPLEIGGPGKAGIVTTKEKLPALIDTLVKACESGEMDQIIAAAVKPFPKRKSAAAPKSKVRAAETRASH